MTRKLDVGSCEHCGKTFGHFLAHSGFGDCSYAYCDSCGTTAILSAWAKKMPRLPAGWLTQQEIGVEMEQHLGRCECGGTFKKEAMPRCPNCRKELSAETATAYLESNAPGTKKGWRWQRNWHETYCIIIENRVVNDTFKNVP